MPEENLNWQMRWRKKVGEGSRWLTRYGEGLERRYRDGGYRGLASDARGAVVQARQRISSLLSPGASPGSSSLGISTEALTKVRETIGAVDWPRVARLADTQTNEVVTRVRELLAGVDWSRMAPMAKKAAFAVAIAAAIGELVDVEESAARPLTDALTGDAAAGAELANVVTEGEETSTLLAKRFIESEVMQNISQMTFDSNMDVLRSIGNPP